MCIRDSAIGDNLNDESMLKLVKYSVAMENAVPELKKISRYITDKPNLESGVADTCLLYTSRCL